MKSPLAIVCKFYNEPTHAPIWAAYYARQVGAAHCYLIDHGSTDGSGDMLHGMNMIRLLRSPQEDFYHLRLIKLFCAALLRRYERVVHVDMDEFLVADPAHHANLTAYATACRAPVVTAIGIELQHRTDSEPDFDSARPLLHQRHYGWFNSAICKPAMTAGPLDWSPGFHCMNQPAAFDDLYMVHLRYFDRAAGLKRLARSRAQPWAHPLAASHQRLSDADWLGLLDGKARLPRADDIGFERSDPHIAALLGQVQASRAGREAYDYRIDLNIHSPFLARIPARFADLF
jgi:hypothetical protein